MSSSAEVVTARVTKPLSSALILGGAHPRIGLSVPEAHLNHEGGNLGELANGASCSIANVEVTRMANLGGTSC